MLIQKQFSKYRIRWTIKKIDVNCNAGDVGDIISMLVLTNLQKIKEMRLNFFQRSITIL